MPALFTHHLVASAVKNKLCGTVTDKKHYYLGAQGGDVFYVYKYLTLRKKVNFGVALHRHDIYKTFENFRKYLQDSTDFTGFSYVLGYITHYATDITFHPYIYQMVKDDYNGQLAQSRAHYLGESYLDTYFLQANNYDNSYVYPVSFTEIDIECLYKLYQKNYFELCGEELFFKPFERAIKNFFLINAITCAQKDNKTKLSKGVNGVLKLQDRLFVTFGGGALSGGKFAHKEAMLKSRPQILFDKAVELAVNLIIEFLQALKDNVPLPQNCFSTDFNIGKV